MNRIALAMAVFSVLAAGAPRAQDVDKLFKAAMNTELVDGNLRAAIEQYEKVVAGGSRALAAQALVRMAECYQKLGDGESRRIYERLVREYADQKEYAAIARGRLGNAAAGVSAKGDRPVWSGPIVPSGGRVSPDGRFLITQDRRTGGLMLRDLVANTDRVLTPSPPSYYSQWTRNAAFSRDGRRVVYEWWDRDQNWRMELRVATLPSSGLVEPRQVFAGNEELRSARILSLDWSPDERSIVASIRRQDRTGQIVLISVIDGSMKVLKSTDWNVPEEVFFSIDGRYIAYDLPAGDGIEQRDIFVLAADGSREIPAVVHGANEGMLGWSPDGTRLLFSSDRTGSWSLWSLHFADGRVHGAPELLKPDIGKSFEGKTQSLGLTRSGALYVHKRISTRDIAVAAFDIAAGKLIGVPVSFAQGVIAGARNPIWSPDGERLAYPSEDSTGIAVRSVATGQVRLLPRTINYAQALLQWSPDGRSLLTRGTDLNGRTALMQIDVKTGHMTPIEIREGIDYVGFAQWSPDGKKVYFNRVQVIVERDLDSGAEREIQRGFGNLGPLSPDGRYLTALRQDAATKSAVLTLVPIAGGEPRALLRLTQPEQFVHRRQAREVWTPDGSALMVVKDTGRQRELWLLPVTAGQPRKIDIDPDIWHRGSIAPEDQGFSLSPDGDRMAFVMGKAADEVWALENFLPAANAKR